MQNLLNKLISIPSVSGRENAIQKYIAEYFLGKGFRPKKIGDNIVVHIQGINRKKAVLFNAHVDTVPPGSAATWENSPYRALQRAGKIYGLGASDEKATVATFMLLAQQFKSQKPQCDVWFMFVVREELDGSGTKEVMDWFDKNRSKYKEVAGILGEPTDLATVEIAHKGNIFLRVTTSGDSGHGSRPDEIHSHAVLQMYKAASVISALAKEWKMKFRDPMLGEPTVGLFTSIAAGDTQSPNKFPDACTATFDIRTTPGLHPTAVQIITKALKGIAAVDTVHLPIAYGMTKKDEAIVRIAAGVTKAKVTVSGWSTDLCFFSAKNIPAVIFGPGTKACIHQPNEYCLAKNIPTCVFLYRKIVEGFGK